MGADGFDLDSLLAPSRWEQGRCLMAQAVERIEDTETRGKVEDAADNALVPVTGIVAAINHLLGYAPGETTVKRHRVRSCGCP